MKKLVYIDACIRDKDSRTKKVATPIINELKKKYDVTTFCINDLKLDIVQNELINKRLSGDIPEYVMEWATTIQNADRVVIAAPFWDMSIPASLKVFIELCSILNVTFKSDDKTCYGNCKSEKLLYITTRGMDISTNDELDQGTSYLKALSFLWGLGEVFVISCQNMDYVSDIEIENKINIAIKEGMSLIENF